MQIRGAKIQRVSISWFQIEVVVPREPHLFPVEEISFGCSCVGDGGCLRVLCWCWRTEGEAALGGGVSLNIVALLLPCADQPINWYCVAFAARDINCSRAFAVSDI